MIKENQICIQHTRLTALTTEQSARLLELTIKENSHMHAILKARLSTSVCWLVMERERIFAWSLLCWFTPDIRGNQFAYIDLFVDSRYRGKGTGGKLAHIAMNWAFNEKMQPRFYGVTSSQLAFYNYNKIPQNIVSLASLPITFWENHRFVLNNLARCNGH